MQYSYQGYGMQQMSNSSKEMRSKENKTRLVIDDSSIYEIDIDCEDCVNNAEIKKTEKRKSGYW